MITIARNSDTDETLEMVMRYGEIDVVYVDIDVSIAFHVCPQAEQDKLNALGQIERMVAVTL